MTDKPVRLDRSKPPPGWKTTTATPDFPLPDGYLVSYSPPHDTHESLTNAAAWRAYDHYSQLARDDERRKIADWLRKPTIMCREDEVILHFIANAIETKGTIP